MDRPTQPNAYPSSFQLCDLRALISALSPRAVWLVLLFAVSPSGGGCSCEGDARITEEDHVAAEETMVNCQCAINFSGLAQDFGGAPESLILDMPVCLPEDLNVHIASPARAAELRALSAADYQALIANFCNTEVQDTVTAAIGFLNGSACGEFDVANCAPVDPSGLGGSASARNDLCEMPCESIACDDTTCNPDNVAPSIGAIDVTQCACTDLSGCGTSVQLCTPPPAFDTGMIGSSSQALTSGVMTRVATPTTRVQLDPAFSDASISLEFCETIIFEICTSDSDSAAVGGYVNLVGQPCPGAACTMSLETWLKADDLDLEFDVVVIEVGEAHIRDLSLTASTDPGGVQVHADGTATIPVGALHIVATGTNDGDRFTFRDTNETAINLTIDYSTGTFRLENFRVDIDEGHATLDLDGTFAPAQLSAGAGDDQALECTGFGGAETELNGSSNASDGALYSWWVDEPFTVAVEGAEVSGPTVTTVAPLGTTDYHLVVSGAGLQLATDSLVVDVTDTQAPMIVAHDVEDECTGPDGQAVDVPEPDVADVCDPSPEVVDDAPSLFFLGDTTVTFEATDASNNSSEAQATVRVIDTTPPVISAPAQTIARCEPAPAIVALTVSATDLCTSDPSTIVLEGALVEVNGRSLASPIPVDAADPRVLLPIGVSKVSWTAEDENGNISAPVLQTITVTEEDTVAACCVAPYTNVVEGNGFPNWIVLPLVQSYCVFGRGSFDNVLTGFGADLISGGAGSDVLQSGTTNDVLLGRDGNDVLVLPVGDGRVYGGNGADTIENTAGGVIYGNAGDDSIIGIFGTHEIVPGPGRDFVDAGPGNDTVIINDVCEVSAFEILGGGFGNDTLITPVPVATLSSLGVVVLGFENIVIDTNRRHLAECF